MALTALLCLLMYAPTILLCRHPPRMWLPESVEEALLQRPTPYGNALFVKKPDIVQAEAMKLGMQQCIMEGGRIVNEEGDELTKLQLRTKGREIIESVQQQMTRTAKKAKKC